jgi:glycosyltransferase involved in cell wall biosynthesis
MVIYLRMLISKYANWTYEEFLYAQHPEYVALRNIVFKNRQHNFSLFGEGVSFGHFKGYGVNFYNMKQNTIHGYFLSFLLKFEFALILRPSVFVSMGTFNLIPFGLSAIFMRRRFIAILTSEPWYDIQDVAKPLRRLFRLLLKKVFQKSQMVFVLSKNLRKELIEDYCVSPDKILLYNYKISEIFNPAVLGKFKTLLNPSGPIVLTICRIAPQKGLEYLIEASRIITEKIPNAKIIIKGVLSADVPSQVAYLALLRKLIDENGLQQNVRILDIDLEYSEMPGLMASADVFVLPSMSEGKPMVVLEAMATGIPVVGSRVGGIMDVIEDGNNGLLVEPKDVEGLSEAIIRILSDKKLRKRLSDGALSDSQRLRENEFESLLGRFILPS